MRAIHENGVCDLDLRWWSDVSCDPSRCVAAKGNICRFRCVSNGTAERNCTQIAAGTKDEMADFIDGWIRVQQVRRDERLELHTWWTSCRASYEEAEHSSHYRLGLDKAYEFFGDGCRGEAREV